MTLRETFVLENRLKKILQDSEHLMSLRTSGGSMYPLLKSGDIVWFAYCSPEKLCLGDLVVWRSEQRQEFVIHRLVRREGQGSETIWFTKGDATLGGGVDQPLRARQISGKVVWRERAGKRVQVNNGWFRVVNPMMAVLSYRLPAVNKRIRMLARGFINLKNIWLLPRRKNL